MGCHHEWHSDCLDQEVQDQQTTSEETKGHWHPLSWGGSSTQDRYSGKTSQRVWWHQTSSLCLDSEPILVAARKLALVRFVIPWIMQRKMSPDVDLQDIAYMRRGRPQKTPQKQNPERNARTEWRKSGAAQANVSASEKEEERFFSDFIWGGCAEVFKGGLINWECTVTKSRSGCLQLRNPILKR